VRLGFAYEANELDSLALESYRQALNLEGEDPKTWYRLAQVRKRLGDRPAAVEAAKVAVDQAPGYAPLRLRLGLWLLEQGKLTQADRWFAQAAELDQQEPAGTWGRARVMMQRNQPHEAEKILQRLNSELPGHSYTHLLLAGVYRELGRAVESAEEFSKGKGAYFRFSDPWNQDLIPYQSGLMHKLRASEQLIESGRLDEAQAIL
jgi:predicted Zn-dependent protease